jgi:hypothetical protein
LAPLPGWQDAEIGISKFADYSLNPENANNRFKAVGFAALGYDVASEVGRRRAAANLIVQLRAALGSESAVPSRDSGFGARWIVRSIVHGPNGRTGTLITVWQNLPGRPPRLITNWLEVHKEENA